jgi:hypothetical protein
MASRISRSFQLVKESFRILAQDKEILLYPVISGILILLVVASFILPALALGITGQVMQAGYPALLIGLFVFYLVSTFIAVFFNAALIAAAKIRLEGGNPTFRDGIRAASSKVWQIFLWALISATVGLVLNIVSSKGGTAGRVAAAGIGALWAFLTFFAVPIIVIEGFSPVAAMKESLALVRKTWGETVIGQISLGLVFLPAMLVAIAPFLYALFTGSAGLMLPALGFMIIAIAVIGVFSAALSGIFRAALYLYARTGREAGGFSPGLLSGAFAPRGGHGNI